MTSLPPDPTNAEAVPQEAWSSCRPAQCRAALIHRCGTQAAPPSPPNRGLSIVLFAMLKGRMAFVEPAGVLHDATFSTDPFAGSL